MICRIRFAKNSVFPFAFCFFGLQRLYHPENGCFRHSYEPGYSTFRPLLRHYYPGPENLSSFPGFQKELGHIAYNTHPADRETKTAKAEQKGLSPPFQRLRNFISNTCRFDPPGDCILGSWPARYDNEISHSIPQPPGAKPTG